MNDYEDHEHCLDVSQFRFQSQAYTENKEEKTELTNPMHWVCVICSLDSLLPFLFSIARCYMKLGDWQIGLFGYNEKSIPQILTYYSKATEHDPNSYKVGLHSCTGFILSTLLPRPELLE